ncbi:predicted protein [Lodderomyces elongisporus NRRL YB-4239]|uniref:Uncharacterized protein n=1 Tax=Lodderomyces elongisporus (strain ATCC 11503 / CBS 2605 / JCM 1781 / NBRC 1676 / NRRL YB-4239) TaxID=379508 RepID=A5E6G0_LODEL|nr:predicted protein [Lodderomyces elongisporus NRRL YB-4239]
MKENLETHAQCIPTPITATTNTTNTTTTITKNKILHSPPLPSKHTNLNTNVNTNITFNASQSQLQLLYQLTKTLNAKLETLLEDEQLTYPTLIDQYESISFTVDTDSMQELRIALPSDELTGNKNLDVKIVVSSGKSIFDETWTSSGETQEETEPEIEIEIETEKIKERLIRPPNTIIPNHSQPPLPSQSLKKTKSEGPLSIHHFGTGIEKIENTNCETLSITNLQNTRKVLECSTILPNVTYQTRQLALQSINNRSNTNISNNINNGTNNLMEYSATLSNNKYPARDENNQFSNIEYDLSLLQRYDIDDDEIPFIVNPNPQLLILLDEYLLSEDEVEEDDEVAEEEEEEEEEEVGTNNTLENYKNTEIEFSFCTEPQLHHQDYSLHKILPSVTIEKSKYDENKEYYDINLQEHNLQNIMNGEVESNTNLYLRKVLNDSGPFYTDPYGSEGIEADTSNDEMGGYNPMNVVQIGNF